MILHLPHLCSLYSWFPSTQWLSGRKQRHDDLEGQMLTEAERIKQVMVVCWRCMSSCVSTWFLEACHDVFLHGFWKWNIFCVACSFGLLHVCCKYSISMHITIYDTCQNHETKIKNSNMSVNNYKAAGFRQMEKSQIMRRKVTSFCGKSTATASRKHNSSHIQQQHHSITHTETRCRLRCPAICRCRC